MPSLDVSEILGDSDLVDDFQVIRSGRSISPGGLTVDTPASIFTYGNVQPTSGSSLALLPEAERSSNYITVVTIFPLRNLTATTAPDQIVFNGLNYRVMQVNDWGQYGRGFVQALCKLVEMYDDGP